jgi:hypothetical protein
MHMTSDDMRSLLRPASRMSLEETSLASSNPLCKLAFRLSTSCNTDWGGQNDERGERGSGGTHRGVPQRTADTTHV